MNIFIFDEDPYVAASSFPDQYTVKLPLETAQLLCTTARVRGFADVLYKSTHQNHPARIWTEESSANWNWLCHHGLGIAQEYTARYGKIHKCQAIIQNMLDRTREIWNEDLHYSQHTEFVQCMPEQYRIKENAVAAYQLYFNSEKRHLAKWKFPATIPEWYLH